MRFLVLAVLALCLTVPFGVLSANAAPKASGPTFHYKCPNGRTFDVRYDKDYTAAFVDVGKKHYRLPAAISASGSRYARGKVEFWEHHGEAMLNGVRGGDNHACKTKTR